MHRNALGCFSLLLFFLPAFSQLSHDPSNPTFPAVAVAPPTTNRIATVLVVFKQQTKTLWSVSVDNQSSLQVQIPRGKLMAAVPSLSQITPKQFSNTVSNSGWAILGRTAQEILILAPLGLTAAGQATKTIALTYGGLGTAVGQYLVSRATARAAGSNDELPDPVAVAANGAGEYTLHTRKTKKDAQPLSVVIQVAVP